MTENELKFLSSYSCVRLYVRTLMDLPFLAEAGACRSPEESQVSMAATRNSRPGTSSSLSVEGSADQFCGVRG